MRVSVQGELCQLTASHTVMRHVHFRRIIIIHYTYNNYGLQFLKLIMASRE